MLLIHVRIRNIYGQFWVFFKGHILIFFHLLVCVVRYIGEKYEKTCRYPSYNSEYQMKCNYKLEFWDYMHGCTTIECTIYVACYVAQYFTSLLAIVKLRNCMKLKLVAHLGISNSFLLIICEFQFMINHSMHYFVS